MNGILIAITALLFVSFLAHQVFTAGPGKPGGTWEEAEADDKMIGI